MLRCLFSLLFAGILWGCGTNTTPLTSPKSTPQVPVAWKDYSIEPRDIQGLTIDSEAISGSGTFVLSPTFPADSAFTLTFSIDPGGSLSLVTHTDNELSCGLKVLLFRVSNILRIEVQHSAMNYRFLGDDMTAEIQNLNIDVTKPVTLTFDIHAHGHFTIIHGAKKTKAIKFPDLTASQNARVGFEMDRATLNSFERKAASNHR